MKMIHMFTNISLPLQLFYLLNNIGIKNFNYHFNSDPHDTLIKSLIMFLNKLSEHYEYTHTHTLL